MICPRCGEGRAVVKDTRDVECGENIWRKREMIKIINNIYKEKCQNCQKCSPELTCTKFYGDNKVVTTVISVYCANCDICDEIELYLEGRKEEK